MSSKDSSNDSRKKGYKNIKNSMKNQMVVSHILEEVKEKFPRPLKTIDLVPAEDIDLDPNFPEEDDVSNADELEHVDIEELPKGEYQEDSDDEDPYCTADGDANSDPKMWPTFLDNVVYRLQNKYRILEMLMNKSFRKVYRAERKKDGKAVVIVASADLQAEYVRNGVPREIRIMHKLKGCKHMAQLLEWERVDPTHFVMVMEHYVDCDLFISAAGNTYAISLVARNLLEALKELEEAHIAHRDIAFENVMWNPMTEKLKVIDFEASSFYHKPGFFRKTGRKGFMAPEKEYAMQKSDDYLKKGKRIPKKYKGYTASADLYSVGVMLWMLFQDENDVPKPRVLYSWVKTAKKRKKHKKYPAVDLIIKLLHKDPRERITVDKALEHPFIVDEEPDEQYEEMRDQLLEMIAEEKFDKPHEPEYSDSEYDSEEEITDSGSDSEFDDDDEEKHDSEKKKDDHYSGEYDDELNGLETEEETDSEEDDSKGDGIEEESDDDDEDNTAEDDNEKGSGDDEDEDIDDEDEEEDEARKFFSDDDDDDEEEEEEEDADNVSVSSEDLNEKKNVKGHASVVLPSIMENVKEDAKTPVMKPTPTPQDSLIKDTPFLTSTDTKPKSFKSLDEIMKNLGQECTSK